MSEYVARYSHFTFKVDDERVYVTSERDEDFEEVYDLPNRFDRTRDEAGRVLYEEFYTDAVESFEEHQNA